MKLDNTTLRLIRAASQAVADECTAILEQDIAVAVAPEPVTAATGPSPTPSKRTRKPATPEPAVVVTAPPVTNVEQPAPAAPAPAAPAPAAQTLPPQSTVTDTELAQHAEMLKAHPDKLRAYQTWRDESEFLADDGSMISGKGMPLSKIPNVGDNRDRLLEAIKRALV